MTRQLIAKVHVNRPPAAAGDGGSTIRPQARGSARLDKWPVTDPQTAVGSLTRRGNSRDKWPLVGAVLRGDKWPVTKSDLGHEKCSTLLVQPGFVASSRSDKWPVPADKWPVAADKWPVAADKWPLS